MSKSKTDYNMLDKLSVILRDWCEENGLECVRCSHWQFNVKEPIQNILIAVYPGSGIMWIAKAHFDNTDIIDKSSTKREFTDKDGMIRQLEAVIFAADYEGNN